jgi:hypothetical protein
VVVLRNFVPGNVHFHRPFATLVTVFPALGNRDMQLALALAGLAGLLVWRWWRVVGCDPSALESAASVARSLSGRYRDGAVLTGRAELWFGARVDTNHGNRPVRVVRTCLGPLYAPTRWTARALLRFGLEAGIVAGAFAWGVWRLGWHWGWRAVVFFCLVFIWVRAGVGLFAVLQRVNGELAELAVLPGLGGRRRQLAALSQASLAAPLTVATAVAALGVVCVAVERTSLAADGGSLLWIVSTVLLGATAQVTVLVGRRAVWPSWLTIAALVVALAAWMLTASSTAHPTRYLAVWALAPLLSGVILLVSARRLGLLAHPFVMRRR